jgi:hypothetical protein
MQSASDLREPSAPSANINPQLVRFWPEAALQCSHHGRSNPRRIPVHPHHGAERLEPEGIAETKEKRRRAVFVDDRLGYGRAQLRHAFAEPLGHAAAMKRQVCNSRAFHPFDCIRPLVRIASLSGLAAIRYREHRPAKTVSRAERPATPTHKEAPRPSSRPRAVLFLSDPCE